MQGDGFLPGPQETTTIFLVRHGETEWNRRGLYQGTSDVPLNRAGEAQARALADSLREVRFGAAYTSPLRRARDTARTVLDGRQVPLTVLPELRELCYGLWQGRGSGPGSRCAPGLEWRWRRDPWSVRFPGGETLSELRERARGALGRVRGAHPGDAVAVFGHGHLNRVLLIEALGWAPERFWSIPQENGCCYVLRMGETGTALERWSA